MIASVLGCRAASSFKFCARERCVGYIGRENARLIFLSLMRAADDIGRGERFDVPDLMEQVRTEQRFLRFFEGHTRVPAVGQMGSLAIAKTVLPGRKGPAISEGARLSADEVVHHDQRANLATDYIGIRGSSQRLIERAALI
jgi:hypothetical protein